MARNDPWGVRQAQWASAQQPRFVVQFLYSVSSPSFTSSSAIANVPGVVIHNTISGISATSNQFKPQEGISSIGGVTVTLQDTGSPNFFTDEIRDQLIDNSEGLRERECRIYVGYSDDFDDVAAWARILTMFVRSFQNNNNGTYTVQLADRSAFLRDSVFDQKLTQLNEQLDASETTISVRDASELETIEHTATFSDAPSATAGYILLPKTGEIIRYTGKSGNDLTGCTRGVLGTVAQPVEFDATADPERYPKVEEFIYLEMPGPQIAYAVLTGVIDPTASPANTLPSHWHAGIAESVLLGWTSIGEDLWDQAAPEDKSIILRFTHLAKTDAKKFVEREIFRLLGIFAPVDSLGQIRLKRTVNILSTTPWAWWAATPQIFSHTALKHDTAGVINQFVIKWNFDGDAFTRSNAFIDADSISRHGASEPKTIQFRGLAWQRFTTRKIADLIATLRDRHGSPPLRLSITVGMGYSRLEPGDIIFVALPNVPDASLATAGLRRPFEIQRTRVDWVRGTVALTLQASSEDPSRLPPPPLGAGSVLPDAFYTSKGTDLDGLAGVTTGPPGHVTANLTLTGGATNWASGSIWYFDGDLIVDAGVTITIHDNVQLRVKGFLTVNGDIVGTGNGLAGTVTPDVIDTNWVSFDLASAVDMSDYLGAQGYFGNSAGSDGLLEGQQPFNSAVSMFTNLDGVLTEGLISSVPQLALFFPAPETDVWGVPADLRGSSGSAGVPFAATTPPFLIPDVLAVGGDGGDGGAGLLIVCRGLGFGASGKITLDGTDSTDGATRSFTNREGGSSTYAAGTGGAGAPGAMVAVLDGDDLAFPTLGGKFFANTGDADHPGTGEQAHRTAADFSQPGGALAFWGKVAWEGAATPRRGLDENDLGLSVFGSPGVPIKLISNANWSNSAFRVVYMPGGDGELLEDDIDPKPPAPTALTVTGGLGTVDTSFIDSNWRDPNLVWEVWESTTNDRSFALRISRGRVQHNTATRPTAGVFYYWVRSVHINATTGKESASDWFPLSPTAGVQATILQVAQGDMILDPTPGQSLNPDPIFADPTLVTFAGAEPTVAEATNPWGQGHSSTGALIVSGVTDVPLGDTVLRSPNTAPAGGHWIEGTTYIPVDRTKTYRIRGLLRDTDGTGPTANNWLGVAFSDDAKANIIRNSDSALGWNATTPSTHWWFAPQIELDTNWVIFEMQFGVNSPNEFPLGTASPVPAETTARFMRPVMLLNEGGTKGTVEAIDVRIDEVADAVSIGDDQIGVGHLVTKPTQGNAVTQDQGFDHTIFSIASGDTRSASTLRSPWGIFHDTAITANRKPISDAPVGDLVVEFTDETRFESTAFIPLDRSKVYRVACQVRRTDSPATPRDLAVQVIFWDENKANIVPTGDDSDWGNGDATHWNIIAAGEQTTDWVLIEGLFGFNEVNAFPLGSASPANTETIARFMGIGVHANIAGTGSNDATYEINNFRIEELPEATREKTTGGLGMEPLAGLDSGKSIEELLGTAYTTSFTFDTLKHPNFDHSSWWTRLQDVDMTFLLEVIVLCNSEGSTASYTGTIEYRYDGGAFTLLTGTVFYETGLAIFGGEHAMLRVLAPLHAKATGWTDTLEIRWRNKASIASTLRCYSYGFISVLNSGSRVTYGTELT